MIDFSPLKPEVNTITLHFFQVISKETTKFIKRLISELKDKFGNAQRGKFEIFVFKYC